MHTFQAAAAAFALACICTETVTLLVEKGWARRCIKALAGLYILAVLLQSLPAAEKSSRITAGPDVQPAELPGLETQILSAAQEQLEATLEETCREKFGVDAVLEIPLAQNGSGLYAVRAAMTAPAGSDAAACRAAAEYLRQELDTELTLKIEEEAGT